MALEEESEEELGSIECFQNYTASEVFVQGLAGIVNQQHVESIIRAQKQMLQRFEKTNEMLANCNTLCLSRLKNASVEFKKSTHLLIEMRKDLANVFKRIQNIKKKISYQYPKAYSEAIRNQEEKKKEEEKEQAANKLLESLGESQEIDIVEEGGAKPKTANSSSSDDSQDVSPASSSG